MKIRRAKILCPVCSKYHVRRRCADVSFFSSPLPPASDLSELLGLASALRKADPESYVLCRCHHQRGKHAPGGGKCSRSSGLSSLGPCPCTAFVPATA